MADADLDSGCLLNKKIRNAQLAQYNFILGEIMLFLQPNYCFATYITLLIYCTLTTFCENNVMIKVVFDFFFHISEIVLAISFVI